MTTSALESAIAVCEDADVAEFTVAAAAREELAALRANQVKRGVPCWCPYCDQPHSVAQRETHGAALSGERS